LVIPGEFIPGSKKEKRVLSESGYDLRKDYVFNEEGPKAEKEALFHDLLLRGTDNETEGTKDSQRVWLRESPNR